MTGLGPSANAPMQQGEQVKVSQSVVVFTHPEHRGKPFDLLGQQGEVFRVLDDWKGRPISPTLPVIVAFGKFRAHFRADELERVGGTA
ncbi:ferredoxin thioredoxin reductase variable alpha subunit [Synechococcus sp. Ace-Pa]|nr:ferredoxin thioredoxin reductase variable alpha subunit [Synechococcus sp. Ace-Pa]